jgi:hypothetical protein
MRPSITASFRFLVVIVPVAILGWIVNTFVPNPIDIVHDIQCLLWLATAICSAFLLRRMGGWPSVLLVIGSVAFFVMHAETGLAEYAMKYEWIPADSPIWQHWGLFVWDTTFGIAMLCFPVGFVWYVFRAIRRA